jgi:hypothetical protein
MKIGIKLLVKISDTRVNDFLKFFFSYLLVSPLEGIREHLSPLHEHNSVQFTTFGHEILQTGDLDTSWNQYNLFTNCRGCFFLGFLLNTSQKPVPLVDKDIDLGVST